MAHPFLLLQNAGDIDATTYASPDLVPDQTLAAFNEAGTGVALNALGSGKVFFVEGGDTPIRTPLIDLSKITVDKKTYEAPVKNSFVISALPDNPSEALTLRMKVIDLTLGFEPYPRYNVEIQVAAAAADEDVAEAFVDALNAITNAPFTATDNEDGTFDIDANENGTILALAFDFGDETAPTVTETTYKEGSGTEAQIKEIELRSFALHGDLYREVPQPMTPPSRVLSGGQYDLFVISAPGDNDRNINPNVFPQIYIAVEDSVEDGEAGPYDLDTFFGLS